MMNRLYLGVAREDITPKLGGILFGYDLDTFSKSINDNLTVTAFAFRCGETKAIMINATICLVCVAFCEEIRREISKTLGVPYENILISSTHTHTGPSLADSKDGWYSDVEYYKTIFYPKTVSAALKAMENMQPVMLGWAAGNSNVGINRRQLTLENEVDLGQNPWAPYNPEMNVLSFKGENGNIVANMITYSAHATAAGRDTAVSRDWPGVMTDALEKESGGLTAFFNGTMGDTGPRLSNGGTTGEGLYHVQELGNIAAQDALRIYSTISEYKDVSMSAATKNLHLPIKPRLTYEETVEYLNNADENPSHLDGYIQMFYKKVKESYENGYVERTYKEIPQTIIRIGGLAFVPFPFEMFTEIGFRIDTAVEDLKVVILSYTNGQLLYMPTQDQLCRGGHEVNMFKYSNVQQYADNTDYHLVTQTLKNIEGLMR